MKYRVRENFTRDPEYALAEILQSRGVQDIENFVYPSPECELNPYDLENIQAAADKLLYHLRKQHKLLLIVDADCDGYTSSAILWLYIKNIFPEADLSFRVHGHKQHGLSDMVDVIEEDPVYDLIICPDASSYDVEEHRRLGELGMDVICLDHHEQLLDKRGNPIISDSPNTIVVNNQLSPHYENKSLCGAGVVYKFCEVLDEILGIQQAYEYIDLAALGEIADVMDRTTTETNYIMLEGLSHIKNRGFRTLIESQSFSLKDRAVYPYKGLTPIDIAFYISPLINAITRVGSIEEKRNMFYCFIDPDKRVPSTKRGAKEGDTESAAEQTARVGKNAKARQDKYKEKAVDLIDFKIQKNQLNDNNILLIELEDSDDIPQEMTGLIAMSIVSKYHKPVMLGRRNSAGELQGSIRSDSNFAGLPSFKLFLEESGLVSYVAGHDNAAGWGLSGKNVEALLKYSNEHLRADDFENCYVVDYALDADDEETSYLLRALASHPEFFGNKIDEVQIVVKNLPLSSIMAMGTNKDSMKISCNGVDYVKFKDEDFVDKVTMNRLSKLTVVGRPNLNTFNGRTSVQLFISDYEFTKDESKYEF